MKVNWNHQLVVYAADVNSRGENVNTVKKNTKCVLVANKVGLKIKCSCLINRILYKIATQIFNQFLNANKSNPLGEAIKRRLNPGNVCHRRFQELSCFSSTTIQCVKLTPSLILQFLYFPSCSSNVSNRNKNRKSYMICWWWCSNYSLIGFLTGCSESVIL